MHSACNFLALTFRALHTRTPATSCENAERARGAAMGWRTSRLRYSFFVSEVRPISERPRYEPLCLLAIGGMASVHLARSRGVGGFEKLLVLKRILPDVARDDELRAMFLDEARIAATLQHSNIVQVFDVTCRGEDVLLAMEFLHGHDLRDVLRTLKGPLPLDQAIAIAIGTCAGLHHAHEKLGQGGQPVGIVHRDVSPHNVFLTYDGAVKVIDFGIAQAANRIGATRSGVVKGKLGYMSPEQAAGRPVDRRCDIFCIGVLLYELSTGQKLFLRKGRHEQDRDVLQRIRDAAFVAPSSHVPGYPAELEHILRKALARDPDARHQTAEQLQIALEAFARQARLDVSASGLTSFMAETYKGEVLAWREAQQKGIGLAEYLVQRSGTPAAPAFWPGTGATATQASAPQLAEVESAAASATAAPPARRNAVLAIAAAFAGVVAVAILLVLALSRRANPTPMSIPIPTAPPTTSVEMASSATTLSPKTDLDMTPPAATRSPKASRAIIPSAATRGPKAGRASSSASQRISTPSPGSSDTTSVFDRQ